jgi:hypothetical protein
MAQFGNYETVSELGSYRGTTVHLARKAGASGQFVVKVFHPGEHDEGLATRIVKVVAADDLAPDAREDFLQAALCQKKAAREGSRHIAPVHDSGPVEERGAWYASDYYPRGSLKKLIRGQYAADAADLYHVVASVVRGLMDLKRHCGRTHGKLKTTNIMVDAKPGRRLANSRIVLSDVAAGTAREAAKLELADLRALGQIIYQLVRRREMQVKDIWPLTEAGEWAFLGKHAEGWRALCNKLCDPGLAVEKYPLEELRKDLGKLRPRLPMPVLVGAPLLALLLLGGLGWYFYVEFTTAVVKIATDPPEVEVSAGARRVGTTPCQERTKPGTLAYGLKLDGYNDANIEVQAVAGRTTNVFVKMMPWSGELLGTSRPPGAKVTVAAGEGFKVETNTPFKVHVPVGKLMGGTATAEVTAQFGNLPAQTKSVVVEKGQRSPVEFMFASGGVRIESQPGGATVLLDGVELGKTPYENRNVAPGKMTYELRLAGHNTDIVQLLVTENQTNRVLRQLTTVSGTVEVRSDPAAEVLRMGVVLGRTPFTGKMDVGRQELTVRHPTLGEQPLSVEVQQGKTVSKEVRFARGGVQLTSDPAGAEVFIGGKLAGRTPYEDLMVMPGRPVTYDVRKEVGGKMLSEAVVLQVADGQTLRTNVVLSSGQGVVVLACNLPGAKVYWLTKAGEQLLGETGAGPLRSKPIDKGLQKLVARHPVLGDQEVPVLVKADAEVAASVTFAFGSVVVRAVRADTGESVAGAEVFAGERRLGRAPWTNTMMRTGPVKFVVQAEDYVTKLVEGDVMAGRTNGLVAEMELGQGTLELKSDPPGAEAFLDNKPIGKLPLTVPAGAGLHQVAVKYSTLDSTLALPPEQVRVKKGQATRKEFKFVLGSVEITSQPTGADVLFSGKAVGRTPYRTNNVPPGVMAYTVTRGGQTKTVTLDVTAGQTARASVDLTPPPPPPPQAGTLTLGSDPPGVEILEGTRSLGGITAATPLQVKLSPGQHQLTARHPELGEQTISVSVPAGGAVTTNFVFAYGSVLVSATPPAAAAEVRAGNTILGPAPWSTNIAKLGRVAYEVRAAGYTPTNVVGDVLAGQQLKLEARLQPVPAAMPTPPPPPPPTPDAPKRGQPMTNSIDMELVWVAGVPAQESGCWVGKHEVTQDEYKKIMGEDPSAIKNPRMPVNPVSFNNAKAFCDKLSEKETAKGIRYVLPTEEQWKYLAADADLKDAVTSKGLDQARQQPEAVGSTGKPNKFGLLDIRGNVWEWCDGPDPQKAVRGGGFDNPFEFTTVGRRPAPLHIDYRLPLSPDLPKANAGFRVLAVPR